MSELESKTTSEISAGYDNYDYTNYTAKQKWILLKEAQKELAVVRKVAEKAVLVNADLRQKIEDITKILADWCKECEHDDFGSECENDCKIIDLRKVLKK